MSIHTWMEDEDDTKKNQNHEQTHSLTWEKRQHRILADLALIMTSFKCISHPTNSVG